MKAKMIFMALLAVFLAFACQKKNSTEPADENIHPQQDIPWPSLADSPWPMFHHDPQSTGRSQYKGPRKGKIKWIFEAEGGIGTGIVIGPDSTIYFGSSYEWRDNTQKSSLYAVKPDGTLKWRYLFDYRSAYNTPLITADGTIFFPGDDNILYSFNPDGSLKKKISVPLGVGFYLSIGLDGTFYFRGGDGYLHAMTQDGETLWKITTDKGFWYYGLSLSTDGSTIYLYSMQLPQYVSFLCAVGTDGNVKWKFPIDTLDCYSSPIAASGGNIIFATAGIPGKSNLFSISPDGKLNWKYPTSSENEPTINKNGIIYFDGIRTDFFIKAVDFEGNFYWQHQTNVIRTSLICDAEGYVYICQPNITAYDNKGNLLWQIPVDDPNDRIASPAIGSDGTLYVGTFTIGKKLYAIY